MIVKNLVVWLYNVNEGQEDEEARISSYSLLSETKLYDVKIPFSLKVVQNKIHLQVKSIKDQTGLSSFNIDYEYFIGIVVLDNQTNLFKLMVLDLQKPIFDAGYLYSLGEGFEPV